MMKGGHVCGLHLCFIFIVRHPQLSTQQLWFAAMQVERCQSTLQSTVATLGQVVHRAFDIPGHDSIILVHSNQHLLLSA